MTVRRLEGRDAATGEVLAIDYDRVAITGITRRGHSLDATLPVIAPGLIDLQVNGYAGYDVNADDLVPEDIVAATNELAAEGVTTWVPTIVTADEEKITAALDMIAKARGMDPTTSAAVPFAHVEGPFISERDGPRGVHDLTQIRPIDVDEVARWAASGVLGYLTVSPHWPDSPAKIAAIKDQGVAVAIGHTHANPEEIRSAVDAGATLSTHLGNGIATSISRHPNQIWTQLDDDRLTCGFIADGHHLPVDTLRVMLRAKGPGRAFVVSDSVALAGSPPGRYIQSVGGEVELSADGRLSHVGSGLLAGSAVSLADCLRFLVRACGLSLGEALSLLTLVPGRVLGDISGTRSGVLRVGAPADLVLVDASAEVVAVVQAEQGNAAR